MCKITLDQLKQYMGWHDAAHCVEIEFRLDGDAEYTDCWLGRMHDKNDQPCYWYGLVADGSQAYDYPTFEAFGDAPVFRSHSLREVWPAVTLLSVEGCDPEDFLALYDIKVSRV